MCHTYNNFIFEVMGTFRDVFIVSLPSMLSNCVGIIFTLKIYRILLNPILLTYLQNSNVAATSNLTPLMLDIWQEAQFQKKSASEGGKTLTLIEKVNVMRMFPPPPNIDFRGAT